MRPGVARSLYTKDCSVSPRFRVRGTNSYSYIQRCVRGMGGGRYGNWFSRRRMVGGL